MEDLVEKLQGILGSPEGQEQLRSIQSMLGMGGDSPQEAEAAPVPSAPAPTLDLSALSGLLGNLGGSGPQQAAEQPALPGIDMNMILQLQRAFQAMNPADDKNARLLMALKPHFSPRRQAKVDQAMSLMRLFSMLPLLRESGIFAGL
ncbi:MAG: hypothetical protein HFE43_06210 [Oscillospiraceae bacterium]|jgi:hypothetical protein|nr:hypothetical protein [Oscillospiraceae bacterium]